jgi:hypothetical protein
VDQGQHHASTNILSFYHQTSTNWKTQSRCWLPQQDIKEKEMTKETEKKEEHKKKKNWK